MRRRRRLVLAPLLCAAAVFPAASLFPEAAGAWTPDEIVTGLSGGGTIAGAAVAIDGSGHATAIWGQAPDAHSPSYSVWTANHTLGSFVAGDVPVWDGFGAISANAVVAGPYGTDSNGVSTLSIGEGASGSAVATWQEGSPVQVEAADARLVIPINPGLRSLNVAMTAAMAAGEALRQIRNPQA